MAYERIGSYLAGDVVRGDTFKADFDSIANNLRSMSLTIDTLLNGAVSVLITGADNTGVGDSTAAIVQAIAESTASGGKRIIYFPAGKYRMTSPIKLPPLFTMLGPGPNHQGSTTAAGGASILIDITNGASEGFYSESGEDGKSINIKNLNIHGNATCNVGTLLVLRNIYGSSYERLAVAHLGSGNAAHFIEDQGVGAGVTWENMFSNCEFQVAAAGKWAFQWEGSGTRVVNCMFNGRDAGNGIRDTGTGGMMYTNCQIQNTPATTGIGMSLESQSGFTDKQTQLANVHFDRNMGTGLKIDLSAAGTSKRLRGGCVGCTFRNTPGSVDIHLVDGSGGYFVGNAFTPDTQTPIVRESAYLNPMFVANFNYMTTNMGSNWSNALSYTYIDQIVASFKVPVRVNSSNTIRGLANVGAVVQASEAGYLMLGSLNGVNPFIAASQSADGLTNYPLLFQTANTQRARITAEDGDLEMISGSYQTGRIKLGSYYLWVDTSGRLRIKSSEPTSATDGTIVGTQS